MAVKHGYTKILNSFFDVMKDVSPSAWGVYLCISRYTHGYHQDDAALSVVNICETTGLSNPTVQRALKELVDKGLVEVSRQGDFKSKKKSRYKISLV